MEQTSVPLFLGSTDITKNKWPVCFGAVYMARSRLLFIQIVIRIYRFFIFFFFWIDLFIYIWCYFGCRQLFTQAISLFIFFSAVCDCIRRSEEEDSIIMKKKSFLNKIFEFKVHLTNAHIDCSGLICLHNCLHT